MNSDIAIKAEGLGKQYRLGMITQAYGTFRDVFSSVMKKTASRLSGNHREPKKKFETIWALKDFSFEVKHGEVLGVIGRNGAGKSTLLKVLSRITNPTEGRVELRGRVGSLLEVGTGFHPELTGRENIFLNGSILGMHRSEIKARFDQIVAFAEIEKFLDTPVKRYSSGMYVRLAFAVAAHLEPEILLVDEVLAVGDVGFQKKCLGKMENVAQQGRTVLFVSHNMTMLSALCTKGLLIEGGQKAFTGTIEDTIQKYLSNVLPSTRNIPIGDLPRKTGHGTKAKIVQIELIDKKGQATDTIESKDAITVRLTIEVYANTRCGAYLTIQDHYQVLVWFDSGHLQNRLYQFEKGRCQIELMIDPTNLSSGEYKLGCGLTIPNQEWIDFVQDAYFFTISSFDPYGTGFDLSQRFARQHVNHKWSPLQPLDPIEKGRIENE